MDGRTDVVRILIAGYTRSHAELLANVLKRDRCIQVVGVVPTSQEVLEVVARCTIDVAVINSGLDDGPEGGLDALRQLRTRHTQVRVVVLLDSAKPERVVKVFQMGAKGIFSRNSPLTLLAKCVRCVHEGQIWISQEELEIVLATLSRVPAICAVDARGMSLLTKRELEVVECVAEGLANQEIAQRLRLSKHTVKNYLFHVFDKLGVSNRVELLFLTLGRAAPNQEQAETRGAANTRRLEVLRERELPGDPLTAYVQCLIAERANREAGVQIAAAKRRLAASMTAEQISRVERHVPLTTGRSSLPKSALDNDEISASR